MNPGVLEVEDTGTRWITMKYQRYGIPVFAILVILLTLAVTPAIAAEYTDLAWSGDGVYTIKTEHDSILHLFGNRNNNEV